ncbi:MAG TPA: alkaline phosphatase family protein [Acidimicrobiales bacterium]|nr:alkaline phosphatase family protein [Acidimicrobiales bacterium]
MRGVPALAVLVVALVAGACGSAGTSRTVTPAATTVPTTGGGAPATTTAARPTTTTRPTTTGGPAAPTTIAPGAPAVGAAAPCAGRPAPATYAHVLVIVMENHGYTDVAAHSPYLNRLASQCGLATNYRAVAHPSLPNYIALTSGGTQGIADDCTACSTGATSIFQQVGADGWKSYEEDLPSAGYTGAASGTYAKKHDPAAYYTAIAGAFATRAVPMGTPTAGALADDLAHDTLPKFGFLTPNLCNDEHDCGIATGDAWLSTWVPKILGSPAYAAGGTALFVTYDEDDTTGGNRVYTVAVAASVIAGTSSDAAFDHYSLLATMDDMLGLGRLGSAGGATSMRLALHL